MTNQSRASLTATQASELSALVCRYEKLPDAPHESIVADLLRIEFLLNAAHERGKEHDDARASADERLLLDRAESLIPLIKACLPGLR